jgi:cysteine desulfurase/selenocysteine lyase
MTTAARNLGVSLRAKGHGEAAPLDIDKIRADFPILRQKIHGKPLVYLDNAATTQKPRAVIDAIVRYYETTNANIHRGVHSLSEHATEEHDAARRTVQKFLNARSSNEIIFVRGTTEAINLVAQTYGRAHISSGDEVLITGMEHHSDIVPWQLLCTEKDAKLCVGPINDKGELDCDFYAFSGHKIYGPTGIGVLYGKSELLNAMPPYQGGGDMIASVTFEKSTYNKVPYKFEAGTPDIAGAIGLDAAIRYITDIGLDRIAAHEHDLLEYATNAVSQIPGVRIVGSAAEKAGVLSFILENVHPHDIGTILDQEGIAIRTGHHCSQPVMRRFNIPATARASFALYNTREEVDTLVRGIEKVREVLA